MIRCMQCGAIFNEVDRIEICYEDEYGIGSMFEDRHYGAVAICPVCGSDELEEVICDCCATCEHRNSCDSAE